MSIPSNIVEGCARASQAEYIRFLEIAFGSAQEVRYQLGLSVRLGFVDPAEAADAIGLADQTCKALNGLLRSLAREP